MCLLDKIYITQKQTRYYEPEFPEINEVVMVEVKSIDELATKVSLLEYNNIPGMIMSSELSSRKVKSLRKTIKVGKHMPATVLSLEKEKNNIDLSIRSISEIDSNKCKERYQKSKVVHSIIRHVADTFHRDIEELYRTISWPLARTYGHAFEGFKKMIQNTEVLKHNTEKLEEEIYNAILKKSLQKMTLQPSKIQADVKIKVLHFDGVLAIKKALRAAQDVSNEAIKIEVRLEGPIYTIVAFCDDKQTGILFIEKAIQASKKVIESFDGLFELEEAPRVTKSDKEKSIYRSEIDINKSSSEENNSDEDQDRTGKTSIKSS
jgi:translation initiation factor 2 subunit 1